MQPDAVEELVKQIYRLGMVQRQIGRQALAELGSQGFVALARVVIDGPLRISDLARALSVDLSVASRQVAALCSAGYVRREPDPDDGRAHRISATDEGRRVLEVSHRRMVDVFGPDRLIWGSDIGQSMLWSYAEKTAMAREAAALLTTRERARFLHDNAARIYRIPVAVTAADRPGQPSAV